MTAQRPLLSVQELEKHFPVTRGLFGKTAGHLRAVDGVTFDVLEGETLSLVGESGCGKTTVGRCVLRLLKPTGGRIVFEGRDVTHLPERALRPVRRDLQVVFQDPMSSLNPRMRVNDIIGEAMRVHGVAQGAEVDRRVADLMEKVGLVPAWAARYPHEFSGGQRQRIGIARALALEPKLIICDEAVSALDVSIQAQVVNLLLELQRELGLSYLFIAHDLGVVRHISHRVAVMYLGELVEVAPTRSLFETPAHPYTRALLSAIPTRDPRARTRRLALAGDVPSPLDPPPGCRFHTRCPAAFERCGSEWPEAIEVGRGHTVRCFHAYDLEPTRDWHSQMSERIERAAREREARSPKAVPPPAVAEALARSVGRPRDAAFGLTREHGARLGSAVFGGALALVAFGHAVFGGVLALGAYLAVVRRRTARKRRSDALLAGALAVSVLAGIAVDALARRWDARREIEALASEIDARSTITGSPPAELRDLGWRLFEVFDDGRAVDPWNQPLVYRIPGSSGAPYELRSHGPDGVPSADDVSLH